MRYFRQAGELPGPLADQMSLYTGSTSVPRLAHVKKAIAVAADRSRQPDLLAYEYHNWQAIRLGIEVSLLMLLRYFELERLPLPPNPSLRAWSFVQETKQKWWEADPAFAYRRIPEILHRRFWDCILSCEGDYTNGPILCFRDKGWNRLPFKLQAGLDSLCAQISGDSIEIYAPGLRHLGRTLHWEAGMNPEYLDFKMNHYGTGYEKYNPVRGVSLCGYRQHDQGVVARVVEILVLEQE